MAFRESFQVLPIGGHKVVVKFVDADADALFLGVAAGGAAGAVLAGSQRQNQNQRHNQGQNFLHLHFKRTSICFIVAGVPHVYTLLAS